MSMFDWPRTAEWDGKDLAAVQVATARLPRVQGRPAAEVDKDWNLKLLGVPVELGTRISVSEAGSVLLNDWLDLS